MRVLVAAGLICLGGAALIGRRLLDAVEVEGSSMAPALQPGDRLIVEALTYRSRPPLAGEIVLASDPRETSRELIKRIAAVDRIRGTAVLAGDAPAASTDSRIFGAIALTHVRWRAIARYWPPERASLLQKSATASAQAATSAGSI